MLFKTNLSADAGGRLYAKGHSLLTDNTAGWLIRGNNDGKDLTAFWRDTAQVEGNGGLIPYDKLLEKYVIGMGGSVVNGYLKDMELNDEAKQQLEALKPQDRKPDGNLPTFFNQKSTPTAAQANKTTLIPHPPLRKRQHAAVAFWWLKDDLFFG